MTEQTDKRIALEAEREKIKADIEELEEMISDNRDIVNDRDLEDVHEAAQGVIDESRETLVDLRSRIREIDRQLSQIKEEEKR